MTHLQKNHLGDDHDAVVHLEHPSPEQTRRQREHYYANVTMIDEVVGNIRAALEERGVADNTILIFTSDHGDALCDHGHSQKWTMYESVVRVPAIIHDPRQTEPHRVDDLVSLFDFGATILEYAGIDPPNWMEARSLRPYVEGRQDTPLRERVYSELARDFIMTEAKFVTMVRDDRYKLVHFADSDEGQLFDLDTDPDELDNLWSDPDHAERKQAMILALLEWRIASGLKAQGWIGRGDGFCTLNPKILETSE